MVEQFAGAATALTVVLAYTILVQVLMSITVLLAQYIVIQIRNLKVMMGAKSPVIERQPYRLGGGIRRWE